MRDARPFERNALIADHVGAEVELVQLQIFIAQLFRGERFARFGHFAHHQLEFGKHRLTVYRALELIEEVVDKVCPAALIRRFAEQMTHKKYFVAGGGNLRDEYYIIARADGLVLAAVIAVQSMAHLMRKRKLAVEIVLVIEQHIGVRAAVAGGICAAALADIFVNVDPAVVEALFKQRDIILTEHGKRFKHRFLCLPEGDLLRRIGNDGGVNVVHMKLVHAEQLLAQRNIAVHFIQVGVHRGDKVVVDLRGNFGTVERSFQRAAVFAGIGKEAKLLELAVQNGSNGVFEFSQTVVIGFEGVAAQRDIRAFEQRNE